MNNLDHMSRALADVVGLITSSTVLTWAALVALACALGAAVGKVLGGAVKAALSIVAVLVGLGLVWYVAQTLAG